MFENINRYSRMLTCAQIQSLDFSQQETRAVLTGPHPSLRFPFAWCPEPAASRGPGHLVPYSPDFLRLS